MEVRSGACLTTYWYLHIFSSLKIIVITIILSLTPNIGCHKDLRSEEYRKKVPVQGRLNSAKHLVMVNTIFHCMAENNSK